MAPYRTPARLSQPPPNAPEPTGAGCMLALMVVGVAGAFVIDGTLGGLALMGALFWLWASSL